MTLRQLEYFVAAAETGSVTAAAGRVYLSQSAISTALAELEETLGVQLFIRHARGLTVTTVGRQILLEARQLLGQVDELHSNAQDLSGSFSGKLSIGCYSTLAPLLLPPIIDAFLTEHPGVDLDFTVGSHADLCDKLRDGTCDVALLYDYDFATDLFPADLTKLRLQSIPPHVVLHPDHKLAKLKSVPLEKLVDEPMILFDLPPGGDYFKSLFERRGMSPTIRFRTTEFELVRSLVARGLGYSILTQHTETGVSYENRPFVTRPVKDASIGLAVVAAHLAGARLTRRASAFIEECDRTLGERRQQSALN
ncbi:LysR family transcriptional regulator [Spelaeicoccus albus]|uniref:LysR family transcriptional regulator n=1 Tax=Spelaeicoccus albus TaxID=1280376 RepID=UPI0015CB2015|nr:LysR family transcriptional regulator [Spelaeicoccus albus]